MALGTDGRFFRRVGTVVCAVGLMASGSRGVCGAVRASLVADRSAVTAGETFTIAVVLEMDEGWHTYWRNPGDSGAPTRISLTLPEGWEWGGMGGVEWPHPKRHALPGNIVDYVYEGRVALLAPVRVGEGENIGEWREIEARVEWLECDADRCVPGSATLRVRVETADVSKDGEGKGLIESQRLKMPRTGASDEVSTSWDGTALVIRAGGRGGVARRVEFFPYGGGGGALLPADDGVRDWSADGGEVRVVFDRDDVAPGGEAWGNLVVERASGEREVWEVRARLGGPE